MQDYQKAFIDLAIKNEVLRFGEFTLKSGRISPYFFNAGQFQCGASIAALGRFYAQTMVDANIDFDMLFGPAYKGISLAVSTAIALSTLHNCDYPVCYNRKEAKQHGEGGVIVGAPLSGKVAIIDDVITAGTAILEVVDIIQSLGAQLGAVFIGLDRQEKGVNEFSAIQEIEKVFGIPVISIIKLDDIIEYLQSKGLNSELMCMQRYREQYGTFDEC